MKKVIITILVAKLCVFLLICVSFSLFPFLKQSYLLNFHYLKNGNISLVTAFSTWDAQHYLFLAQNGYAPNAQSNIFFPLYPLLIRIFSPLFRLLEAGLVVANSASVLGCIYFYGFVKNYFQNKNTAYFSLLTLLIFPTSFFFSLVYSESIFFCLVMACFYYLYKRKILFASVCAFFIPLSRPTGIFILLPLFVYVVEDYKHVFGRASSIVQATLPFRGSLLLFAMPFFGFGSYLVFMFFTTGNMFSGIAYDTAKYFFAHNVIHWNFLQNISLTHLSLHDPNTSLVDRLFFLFFLSMLPVIWKKTDKVLFSYAISMGMVPLLGSFMSYTRYLLVVFPLFVVLGAIFSEKKYATWRFVYAYPCLLLQALFIIMQSLNYWVA